MMVLITTVICSRVKSTRHGQTDGSTSARSQTTTLGSTSGSHSLHADTTPQEIGRCGCGASCEPLRGCVCIGVGVEGTGAHAIMCSRGGSWGVIVKIIRVLVPVMISELDLRR